MMEIPDILKGDPHLPLTETMTMSEAVSFINMFYQTQYTMNDFKETQVFKYPNGTLGLEALDRTTGKVLIRFMNKSTGNNEPSTGVSLPNPLDSSEQWMGPHIKVDSAAELAFLDKLGSGNTYPTLSDNTLAWQLCKLLNEYNAVGHWKASTFSAYSTAGFELVYKGPSEDAPSEYLVGDSEMVVILRFHNGKNKGMLCLKS